MTNALYKLITGVTFALVSAIVLFTPVITRAVDNSITNVVLDSSSSTIPSETSAYQITFTMVFGLHSGGGFELRMFPVTDDVVGDSSTTAFDFSTATLESNDIAGTLTSISSDQALTITTSSDLSPGTYTMILDNIVNTATTGDYAIGLSSQMNPTDSDFTTSDAFTLADDPCVDVTTAILTGVDATAFGTNIGITRNKYVDGDVTNYKVVYATNQDDIDTGVGTTLAMNKKSKIISSLNSNTDYYFQVQALDSNECVLASADANTTTEKKISNTRYQKPRVNNIKNVKALIQWPGNEYINEYTLQLWQGKYKIKTFKHLSKKKKQLTDTYLDSGTNYKVRVKAKFITGETGKWSKYKSFTTK